uniref:protein brambleberry-like isoform X2 n=1 Tax=Myxine glutinosa TaxID=7769 RepID=UPI00358EF130
MRVVVLVVWLGLVVSGTSGVLFNWFRINHVLGESSQDGGDYPLEERPPVVSESRADSPRSSVAFELAGPADDGFLAEGKQLELSPLNECHNQVITQLQSSCHEMSEEDVSKLGVALLNCQSFVEGRRVYSCSNEMTLFECTREMDPTTWNAYHILSNRARSLCFALRQQQFRVQTEFLVNSLATSAIDQVKSLQAIEEGHEKLSEATSSTLQQMLSGQEKLSSHQDMLVKKQKEFQTSMGVNMQELTEQQSLVASGHQIVAKMTDDIKAKIDGVSSQLVHQDLQIHQGHETILQDLLKVNQQSEDSHHKLELQLELMESYQGQTDIFYRDMLSKLQRVNNTIDFLLTTMDGMHHEMSGRLEWLAELMGGAGDRLAAVQTCITHLGFFLLAAFLAVFLQAPALQRGLLLLVIPTNALVKIQIGTSMDFFLLSLFILMGSVCCMLVKWIRRRFWTFNKMLNCAIRSPSGDAALPRLHSTSAKRLKNPEYFGGLLSSKEVSDRMDGSWESPIWVAADNSFQGKESSIVEHSSLWQRKVPLESSSKFGKPSMSSTLLGPQEHCTAVTRVGLRCKNRSMAGEEFCNIHCSRRSFFQPISK